MTKSNNVVPVHMSASDAGDAWEAEMFLNVRRRARMWQWFGGIGLALGVLGLGTVLMLLPLKEFVPIAITVDRDTGNANVTSTLGTITVSDEEAIAQALIYQYVRDRETYDALDQRLRANKVFRFSRGAAAQDLRTLYAPNNPLNPIERYGRRLRGDIEIVSIVLPKDGERVAQVRFKKSITGERGMREENFMVTLGFGFDRTAELTLEQRWENPTGFYVDAYRIDREQDQKQERS